MKRGKIFLVDDDYQLRDSLALFLDESGFEVAEASNGAQAIQAIFDFKPDLLITDLMMPGMSGLSVLEKMKERCPSMKIVVMSGLNDKNTKEKVHRLGAFTFLQKPVNLEQIEQQVLNKIFKPLH